MALHFVAKNKALGTGGGTIIVQNEQCGYREVETSTENLFIVILIPTHFPRDIPSPKANATENNHIESQNLGGVETEVEVEAQPGMQPE